MDALIDDRAIIDDDEEDESFDEETGEVRTKSNGLNGRLDDSSEEEDEDDEEAAAEVRYPQQCRIGACSVLIAIPGCQRLHCRRRRRGRVGSPRTTTATQETSSRRTGGRRSR